MIFLCESWALLLHCPKLLVLGLRALLQAFSRRDTFLLASLGHGVVQLACLNSTLAAIIENAFLMLGPGGGISLLLGPR